jgi:predicted RNA-binding Zn-ribbon protein involved in translation (DUF1610 family)
MPKNMELRFKCPDCGEHELDQIIDNMQSYQRVSRIIPDEPIILDGEIGYDGGDKERYVCIYCGYEIQHDSGNHISDFGHLCKWIEENCPQE